MKTQTQITANIIRAAQREAQAWHKVCQAHNHGDTNAMRASSKKWETTRQHLADTLNLHGDDRCRARLIYWTLRTLNGYAHTSRSHRHYV